MPLCNQCQKGFGDYQLLASHIMGTKGHRKGRRWAAKYLMINGLSAKNRSDLPRRVADNPDKVETEFGDENRQNMKRELSGAQKNCITVCPKCKSKDRDVLPVEFAENPVAWRIEGTLARLCSRCSYVH